MLGSTTAAALLRGLFNDPQALITFPYMGSGKAFIVEAISGFNLAYVATAVTTGFYTVRIGSLFLSFTILLAECLLFSPSYVLLQFLFICYEQNKYLQLLVKIVESIVVYNLDQRVLASMAPTGLVKCSCDLVPCNSPVFSMCIIQEKFLSSPIFWT